ncbi:MAG: hypothetical protein RBT76_04650 [candidate division Zixibacteria bacterium]|nr:hypothetical protein [candidate division Zixibacteria bacterium]
MRMRLSTIAVCVMLLAGASVQAQFQQSPLDLGAADTLDMVVSVSPDATTNKLKAQFDLWAFNDSNTVAGATVGFGWENDNMLMDSAKASDLVRNAFTLVLTVYKNNSLATTNADHQFNLAGTRSFDSPGILPADTRRLWASYYFTLSSWSLSDSIVVDTNTYAQAVTYQFGNPDASNYKPYWTGPEVVRDTAVPSNLLLSEDTLFFTAEEGGTFPPNQTFDVTSDNAPLAFTLVENAAWIIKSPSSGTTPRTITVSINTTALPAGVYFDSIAVESPSAGNSPQFVYVQLDLQQPPPVLLVSPNSFIFNAVAGGNNPPTQNLTITNTGGSTLDWTATNSQPWLQVIPGAGTGDAVALVSVDITGLTFNDYFDTIVVSDPAATNSPQLIPVRLTVGSDLPILAADSAFNYIVVDLPEATPPPRDFTIVNAGAGLMTFEISNTSSRITLSDSAGTAPFTITASFDVVGEGTNGQNLYDTIWVTSPEAINSPFPIVFQFHFVDIPARVVASPGTLTFNIYECFTELSTDPYAQNISVINGGGDNPLRAFLVYESDLFTVDRDTLVAPGVFKVTPNILTLPVGTYYDTILVGAQNAINSPDTVFIVYNHLEGTDTPIIRVSRTLVIEPIKIDAGPVSITGFDVTNQMPGCMDWTLEEDCPWAFPSDTAGSAGDNVSLVIDPTGFPRGEYLDTIYVYSDEAANSPQLVRLILRVWDRNGDVNWDGELDLSDLVYLVTYLFLSGPGPMPEFIVGDVNCDNLVDLSDLIYLSSYLFLNGPEPCGNPFKAQS